MIDLKLIQTVDKTIARLNGESKMSDQELFAGFDEEKQKEYADQARQRWGSQAVDASLKRWGKYSAAQKAQIIAEGEAIRRDLAANMRAGFDSPAVQQIVAHWHQHMKNFYEPSIERLRGLGNLYVDDPDFRANYAKLDPGLPEFFRDAIEFYCNHKK
ncbi:MAG: TipAS antibiotic-recognition domain-containing protein [Chloroflexi bacterium]|nr:TipAS antibiotic-recognition domain-containing protein [Chloroflexota bacterium]